MNRFFTKNIHYALKSELVHDIKNKIFFHEVINVKGNFIIKIEYKKIDDLFVLYHTEVPIEHRYHGLGYFIAKEVFDYLIEHKFNTALYCPFLIKYKTKYPRAELNTIIEELPTIDKSPFEYLEEPWD